MENIPKLLKYPKLTEATVCYALAKTLPNREKQKFAIHIIPALSSALDQGSSTFSLLDFGVFSASQSIFHSSCLM
jgi:hypothetical protein